MRRGLFTAAVWAGLTASIVVGQDGAVTIKRHKPAAGDATDVVETDEKNSKTTFVVKGKTDAKIEKEKSRLVYSQEVQKVAAEGQPTKLRREYKTVELTRDGKKEELKLDGQTIIAEKKDGKFEVTFADGKAPEGKTADYLAAKFKNFGKDFQDDEMFPSTPIKAGETWKIDATKLAKSMMDSGLVIDPDLSTGSGRLIRVYEKNGHKFGVLAITLELVVTKVGSGEKALPLKTGSKMKVEVSGDGCIDGTEATGSMKMKMSAELVGDVPNVELLIQITSNGSKTTTEGKKK